MKALFVLLLPLTLVLCLPATGAADVLAARGVGLAHACAACHGPDGQSQGAIPSLDALSAADAIAALRAGARHAWTQTAGRVVVVGGGFGGVTCAKSLRCADATLDVTLVEPHRQFVTCPFSVSVQQSALSFQQAPGESSSPRGDGIEGCTEELHHDVCHDARRTTAQSAHAATAARHHWRAGGTVAS